MSTPLPFFTKCPFTGEQIEIDPRQLDPLGGTFPATLVFAELHTRNTEHPFDRGEITEYFCSEALPIARSFNWVDAVRGGDSVKACPVAIEIEEFEFEREDDDRPNVPQYSWLGIIWCLSPKDFVEFARPIEP